MSRLPIPVCLALLCGCGSPGPKTAGSDSGVSPTDTAHDAVVFSPSVSPATALTETIAACDGAASIVAHQMLCQQGDAVVLVDESTRLHTALSDAQSLSAMVVEGETWVALDGAVYALHDGVLIALNLGLPVPVEALAQHGGTPWLAGAGRLFQVTGGTIQEVLLDGHPTIHGLAATADMLYLSVPQLVAIRRGPELQTLWAGDAPLQALATDEDGVLWTIVDDTLHRVDGDGLAVPVALPAPVTQLVGPALWAIGPTTAFHLDGHSFVSTPLPDGPVIGVDALGRLLQLHDGALVRHALGRPVAVVGLPPSLQTRADVQLLPTDPASLTTMTVWVDDQRLVLKTDPHRVTLDPEGLMGPDHTLRFVTTSPLGDHISTQALWVGDLPDVTWDDVATIHTAHCAACHGGDTATRLDSADAWRAHIDPIIALVSTGEMPLGGPSLSEDNIVAIRAWKHGGFL